MLKHLKLSHEAMLFDSPLYILKAFLGVLIAYVLFSRNSLIGKDMISVLFGMMLTLEPVNITGLKSGKEQIQSTIIGGAVAFVIVIIGGVNWITVPLAVCVTLYASLLLNWRNVPAVAIFTAIYMTQYIQFDGGGNPSMWLTLRLRMLALVSGISVGVALNYVFSLFFYKKMILKRSIYILEKLSSTLSSWEHLDDASLLKAYEHLSLFEEDVNFVQNHLSDLKSEKNTQYYQTLILHIRHVMHEMHHMLYRHLFDETYHLNRALLVEVSYLLRAASVMLEAHGNNRNRHEIEMVKLKEIHATDATDLRMKALLVKLICHIELL